MSEEISSEEIAALLARESMSKEKQIQDYETKQLINELSKMPPMVIATAYLHAINYTLYGEDVTEKWVTATQNASALEKAYRHGYYDAMQRQTESEDKEKLSWLGKNCKDCGNEKCKKLGTLPKKYDCALWRAESEDKG